MRHGIHWMCIAILVVLGLTGAGLDAADDDAASAVCGDCHEDVAAAFATTGHGLDARGGPSCVTCHSDGPQHAEEGEPAKATVPSGQALVDLCRSCHGRTIDRGLVGIAAHRAPLVDCGTCHDAHPAGIDQRAMLREQPAELCADCHPVQVRELDRPYGHRVGRGGLECISCHDPHAGRGGHSLARDTAGEVACLSCHADKRGPFVYSHVSGPTGDCSSCHTGHGSTNPNMLTRARVEQLCLECHSPIGGGTVGSQPPSRHDLRSPRYRNCTVCHAAVHGSNTSPMLLK
jgi:DmsE family decaheme c-type cytochrome